jgi:hypothetical protein
MVCIAAFIVLVFLSIFSARYRKPLKKAWGCVARRVTLQKCETSFKSDIKNSILSKVVVKRPKLVKPLSIAIEVGAVLIVVVTVWSLLTVVKSGLALYVYGTCDVSTPSSCSLDASQSCAIDDEQKYGFFGSIGHWFGEFGEVIAAVPSRIKHWDASEYLPSNANYYNAYDSNKPVALDIFDPGCFVCKDSYNNQLKAGFFDKYNVALMPYPIGSDQDGYKFKNSYLITKYIEAVRSFPLPNPTHPADWLVVDKLFTGENDKGIDFQTAFNSSYSDKQAEQVLQDWLVEFGYTETDVANIATLAHSSHVEQLIANNKTKVDKEIKTKKIPTMLYDGKKHSGLFKLP